MGRWGRSAPASRELPVPGGWGRGEEGARPQRFSNTLNPSEHFLHLMKVFEGLYGFLKDRKFCEGPLGEGVDHFIKHVSVPSHQGCLSPCPLGVGHRQAP